MLYQATHWTRSKYESALQVNETRIFGSKRAAELWARSVLEPVVTTRGNYHRDIGRADSVDVSPLPPKAYTLRQRCGVWARNRTVTIEPEVHIVPSVGELGWTP